ncbi:exodeoxyribonuclease V subunit alpha [Vibrio tritonius]|uniref:exodeoxyribonuclease V subunit alpha n=1 Tax=Vibrio tritonius TaxID=1435069 RepID=UPI0008385FBB|nr:exodeoxyribonuclease V subunit alpha [Vibrio tritonius]
MNTSPLTDLSLLAEQGAIRQLDYQFARFIGAQCQPQEMPLTFLAAVLSAELGRGHICLPMWDENGQLTDFLSKLGVYGASAEAFQRDWLATDWIGLLNQSSLVSNGEQATPLVFDGNRLYLHRYWYYEVILAQKLGQFASPLSFEATGVQKLRERLDELFSRDYLLIFKQLSGIASQVERQRKVNDLLDIVAPDGLDWQGIDRCVTQATTPEQLEKLDSLVPLSACLNWQKVAAAVALTRRFTVISGGPGTGKTTTVTKLLAALISQATQSGSTPTIKLVAPTGKAAARLTESIAKAVEKLPVEPELKALIPTESSTIHRLLGAMPHSVEFRHHQHNPLHLDLLVVDEASMVDLSLMVKLVEALPKHARLVLLGDKDQLASVEAGAVLGDICSFLPLGYGHEQGQRLADLTGFATLAHSQHGSTDKTSAIADCLCMLQKSYRFNASSGIGQLARAVNSGQALRLDTVWEQKFSDIEHHPLSSDAYQQMIQTLVKGYSEYLDTAQRSFYDEHQQISMTLKAKMALQQFSQIRLLCAVREGDFGVLGLNLRVERALAARKKIKTQDELWYHGRPVMVTSNDHGLGLYNGDIGLCLEDESDESRRLKVYFELPDGSVKGVLPSRVPPHETAYAMTIHKSQGSEFNHTLMILPPEFSPILTRELIYTGITRAKQRLDLYCDLGVLKRGIKIQTRRASGLRERFH